MSFRQPTRTPTQPASTGWTAASPSRLRAIRKQAAAGLCVLLLASPSAWAEVLAADVKAAYVYNFARFVQWPASAFENEQTPLWLCLHGSGQHNRPFATIQGRQANGRLLQVRQLTDPRHSAGCHILFIDQRQLSAPRPALQTMVDSATLTISDAPWFTRQGGMVSLYTQQRKVKFRINQTAVQQADLSISARLLKLAEEVHP